MRRIALALVGLLVATTVLAVSERALIKALPERWKVWLEGEIYPLITGEQRKAFLKLTTEAERQAFAEQMWIVWAGENELGPEFRRIYEERVQDARELFDNTIEDRSRVSLLHGAPDSRAKVDCETVFNPMEIWQWGRLAGLGRDVVVIFFKPYGLGQFRLWDPVIDGRNALYTTQGLNQLESWRTGSSSQYQLARPEYRCSADIDILRVLELAAYWMNDLKTKQAMQHVPLPPGGGGNESVSQRFLEFSTVAPEGAEKIEFDFAATVKARRGGKVALALAGTVPRVGLASSKVGELEVVKLDVTGQVSRKGGMVDRFRYAFTFPAASSELPIVIERELRPGTYSIRIKVADENSNHAAVQEHEVVVEAPELPVPSAAEVAGNEAIEKVAKAQEATLLLRGPEGDGVSGVHRFTALTGPAVTRVDFFLDSRLILGKNRPPFDVDLDLGPVPRLAAVVAVAFDAGGREIDRKQIDLNVGRERFFVRLQPISASDRQGGRVRAVVTVNVPSDRTLQRVDLFWNEGLA
ncbi:MAG: GWxTD domain-containing protein, partial [Acidobacteria bacterium]|nr:GWxTD domain-containing protein [Acidobacteriota bacterium]